MYPASSWNLLPVHNQCVDVTRTGLSLRLCSESGSSSFTLGIQQRSTCMCENTPMVYPVHSLFSPRSQMYISDAEALARCTPSWSTMTISVANPFVITPHTWRLSLQCVRIAYTPDRATYPAWTGIQYNTICEGHDRPNLVRIPTHSSDASISSSEDNH